MTETLKCDVLIVGGGPGGYPAAIRAGQHGLDTIIVEADRMGGTCLIRGCIPSKAIIHAADRFASMAELSGKGSQMGLSLTTAPDLDMKGMQAWKNGIVDQLSGGVSGLLKRAGVKIISGWATFSNAKTCTVETKSGTIRIEARSVVLAAGSKETELSVLPFDGKSILSSRDVLNLEDLPDSVTIVGAGYIGLELGIALSKLGTKVRFVEASGKILPGYDEDLTRPVSAWLKAHDIDVHLNAKANRAEFSDGTTRLHFEVGTGETQSIDSSKIIVAVGRRPALEDWGLDAMGIDMDPTGRFIKIDNQCRTSMSGVFAVGDITGEPMLAHRATAQGECVADILAGKKRVFDPRAIAAVCFTDPEIVSAGMSPHDAKASGEDVIVSQFPFAASGRALSMNAGGSKGFVRIVARKSDHVVLGLQAVGAHVSELSGEFALALEMGAVLEDIAATIHVHPTLTEATAEAAMVALGHPIHVAAG